jgi:hypothetical protein
MNIIRQNADGLVIIPEADLETLLTQSSLKAIELYEVKRLEKELGEKVLTTKEAQEFLKLTSDDALQRQIQKGLPYVKSSPNKFKLSDLTYWLENRMKVRRVKRAP